MASIELNGTFKPMVEALDRIALIGRNPARILDQVGEQMLKSTKERFHNQAGPDGSPWAPVHPDYAATKPDSRILFRTGELFGGLEKFVDGNRLVWGSQLPYAKAHQFGATIIPRTDGVKALRFWIGGKQFDVKKVVIPARPYLGFTAEDRQTVLEELHEFLDRAMSPR